MSTYVCLTKVHFFLHNTGGPDTGQYTPNSTISHQFSHYLTQDRQHTMKISMEMLVSMEMFVSKEMCVRPLYVGSFLLVPVLKEQ